jgi:hypothetical protein
MSIKIFKPLFIINVDNVHEFISEKLEIAEMYLWLQAWSTFIIVMQQKKKKKVTKMKECAIRQ